MTCSTVRSPPKKRQMFGILRSVFYKDSFSDVLSQRFFSFGLLFGPFLKTRKIEIKLRDFTMEYGVLRKIGGVCGAAFVVLLFVVLFCMPHTEYESR